MAHEWVIDCLNAENAEAERIQNVQKHGPAIAKDIRRHLEEIVKYYSPHHPDTIRISSWSDLEIDLEHKSNFLAIGVDINTGEIYVRTGKSKETIAEICFRNPSYGPTVSFTDTQGTERTLEKLLQIIMAPLLFDERTLDAAGIED